MNTKNRLLEKSIACPKYFDDLQRARADENGTHLLQTVGKASVEALRVAETQLKPFSANEGAGMGCAIRDNKEDHACCKRAAKFSNHLI